MSVWVVEQFEKLRNVQKYDLFLFVLFLSPPVTSFFSQTSEQKLAGVPQFH